MRRRTRRRHPKRARYVPVLRRGWQGAARTTAEVRRSRRQGSQESGALGGCRPARPPRAEAGRPADRRRGLRHPLHAADLRPGARRRFPRARDGAAPALSSAFSAICAALPSEVHGRLGPRGHLPAPGALRRGCRRRSRAAPAPDDAATFGKVRAGQSPPAGVGLGPAPGVGNHRRLTYFLPHPVVFEVHPRPYT